MSENMKDKAVSAAVRYLTRRDYEILDERWHSENGAYVDIVACDDDDIVFVDVRYRDDVEKGLPEEDVTGSRERVERAAATWLAEHADSDRFVDHPLRFDDISLLVLAPDRALIRHHQNAFGTGYCD